MDVHVVWAHFIIIFSGAIVWAVIFLLSLLSVFTCLFTVELPAADAGLEVRPRPGHGKHSGDETRRADTSHSIVCGTTHQRGNTLQEGWLLLLFWGASFYVQLGLYSVYSAINSLYACVTVGLYVLLESLHHCSKIVLQYLRLFVTAFFVIYFYFFSQLFSPKLLNSSLLCLLILFSLDSLTISSLIL